MRAILGADGGEVEILIRSSAGSARVVGHIVEATSRGERKLFSQNDPRWRGHIIAPGHTIGRSGCYITSLAMFLSERYTVTPDEVCEMLRAAGVLVGADVGRPERISSAFRDAQFVGRWDWLLIPADVRLMKEWAENNYGVLLWVKFAPDNRPMEPANQHFVLLWEWDSNPFIADPWDGNVKRLLPRFGLSHWDTARAVYGARVFRWEASRGQ